MVQILYQEMRNWGPNCHKIHAGSQLRANTWDLKMNSVQISREMLEGTIKLVSAKSMPSFLIAVSKTLWGILADAQSLHLALNSLKLVPRVFNTMLVDCDPEWPRSTLVVARPKGQKHQHCMKNAEGPRRLALRPKTPKDVEAVCKHVLNNFI